MVRLRENLPTSCVLMKVSDKTKTNPTPISKSSAISYAVRTASEKKRKSEIPAVFKLVIRTFFQEND